MRSIAKQKTKKKQREGYDAEELDEEDRRDQRRKIGKATQRRRWKAYLVSTSLQQLRFSRKTQERRRRGNPKTQIISHDFTAIINKYQMYV